MATGAEILEPVVSSTEHSSEKLGQVVNEFSVEESQKSHVELQQPLQAMENLEKLGNANGCNIEESLQVVHESNGRSSGGESFSESPPGDFKAKEGELEVFKEENAHQETSREECAAIVGEELSVSQESAREIEPEKFQLGHAEMNLGETEESNNGASSTHSLEVSQSLTDLKNEVEAAKPVEDGAERKRESAGFGLSIEREVQTPLEPVNESKIGIYPEEVTGSIAYRTAVLDSAVVEEGEEGSIEQSKLDHEKPEDGIRVATQEVPDAEAAEITEEETSTMSNLDKDKEEETITSRAAEMETGKVDEVSGREEETITSRDAEMETRKVDEVSGREEETITSRDAEMETGKLGEVPGSKPEEEVTEKDESPSLTEKQAEDAYEGASKSMEITDGAHLSTEKDVPLVKEAGQLRCEVGETEIEKLSEVSDLEPKDQVNEDGEASTATETKPEDEPKNMVLTEEGEKSEAVEKLTRDGYEHEEQVIEKEETTAEKETQAEDEAKASKRKDNIVEGHSSEVENLLLVEDADKLNNGVNDIGAEKPDETPSIECKGQVQVENEAPVSEETQTEDIAKARESMETAALVDPSTEKENLLFIQEACQSNSGVDNKETERKNDISSFKTEDLIHEEHEDHKEKITQAEDKTEADESMEIAIAGYSATEQNLSQNQAGEELGNAPVIDAEVEKLNGISNSRSEEQENGEHEGPVAQEIQAVEESETRKDSDGKISEHLSTEKEYEMDQAAVGDKDTADPIIKETVAAEARGMLVSGTDIADSSKEVHEEQLMSEQAAEATVPSAEENDVACSAEDTEPRSSENTSDEANLPITVIVSRHSEEETSPELSAPMVVETEKIEVKEDGDEEPSTNLSPPGEVASIEDEKDEVSEVKIQARSAEEIDMKDDTLNLDDGREKTSQYVSQVLHAAESDKNEEITWEKSSADNPESSPILPQKELREASAEVHEAPEDVGNEKIEEISMQEEKLTVANTTEDEQSEGSEMFVNDQMQNKRDMHNSDDAEILVKNETGDATDQGKMDESEVSDGNSSTQNIQIDESQKTESIPPSSENDKTILEESMASTGLGGEDYKPENVAADSKLDASAIEKILQDVQLVEEAGQLRCEVGETEIEKLSEVSDLEPKDRVNGECEASTATEAKAEDEPKNVLLTEGQGKGEVVEKLFGDGYEHEEQVIEEEETTVEKETQAEDESKASKSEDNIVEGQSSEVESMKQNLLLVEDADKLNNGVNDTGAEKPDETPSIECKGQVQVENEAPVSKETQTEDIAKASESMETAALVDPSTEKENLPSVQEPGQSSGDEEPSTNLSPPGEVASLEDEKDEVSEVKIQTRSTEEIDMKDDTLNLDDGREKTSQYVSQVFHAAESDKNEEITWEKSSADNPESSPILPQKELREASAEVHEAPEDVGNEKIEEISMQEEKLTVANTTEDEQSEGSEMFVNDQMQNKRDMHNSDDAEILVKNETGGATDQGKMDESEVSDGNSSTQNIQIDESQKTESIPPSSENDKTILEESMASTGLGGEDYKPENVAADSKLDASAIEKVSDPSDAGKGIDCDSEPAPEDQSYEALSGIKEDTFQKPDESPFADDANKTTASEISSREIKEIIEPTLEAQQLETVNETTDAIGLTQEHDDTDKASEDEKEVTVQDDVKTETSLDAEVREEKCAEEEDVQTTGAPKSEIAVSESIHCTSQAVDEVDVHSHEETVRAETQERDSEMPREVISEAEAPELSTEFEDADQQTVFEEVTSGLEPVKIAEENDSVQEKVSNEEVHDAEILMRNANVDITDQCKTDEPKFTEENSLNQNVQKDDSGCEEAGAEALNNTESLPEISETEKMILEESVASRNLDRDLEKDNRPEDALVDSKSSSYIIEEVNDSADTESSCVSEAASGDKSREAVSGTEAETLQVHDARPASDDVNESTGVENLPSVMSGCEIKETVESKSDSEQHETVGETIDATKLIEEHDDVEKTCENDKDVKVQHDVKLESSLADEVSEEKCLEEEDVQRDRSPKTDLEVNDSIVESRHLEDEVNIHTHEETIKPEIQEKDGQTTQEVMSETEVHGLEFKDLHKQTTSAEVTARPEPERQCEKTAEANDSVEDKVSGEEVDNGEGKAHDSESLEEQVIDEITVSKEIHTLSPVICTTIEETETGPGLDCTEDKAEMEHSEEITIGNDECESTKEDLGKEKMQEQAAVSIPQTEDAREETLSNLMSQQSMLEQENAEKEEAAIQDRDDEHEGSTVAPVEACDSNRLETEEMNAVEATFEEEKLELTGSTREIEEVSREVDVSDSQPTESVSGKEINSDQSRELEAEVPIPVPTVIPENIENETVAMQEQAIVSIPQTEDAREESSSNLMSQQSLPKQETAQKEEAAIQDLDDEHGGSKVAPEEACDSNRAYTEATNAVEATFEEEKLELTGSTREIEEVSREVDVSDSQHTESVSGKETNSDQSRELEFEVPIPVPTVIPENIEKETVVMQEQAAVSLPQTEDARDETSSNLMSQQSLPKQETAEKEEAAIQDRDDEHEGSKVAPQEACHSSCPDTEVMNAVEATFEEEKLELTGSTRDIEVVSKEVDASDSQPTESVCGKETNSDQSRELEAEVPIPVPTVIPENIENETVPMQGQAAVSITQTEDAGEESSSNLMSQKSIPKRETAEKEEVAIQDHDDEHEGSKVAPQEACHSNRPDTEVMNAVEATFEEEKLELTGSTRDIEVVSKEVDVFDSQPTESVCGNETNSDQSRVLEAEVPIPVPAVIPEHIENETVAMQEQAAVSISQTEDAGEESSYNLMNQQSIPKLESAEKGEAAIQDHDDEHEGSKVAPQEACHSKRPDTEVMNVIEATFEEEKLELTGNTRDIEVDSKEVDVSDSQPTESVCGKETNSDQSRELEAEVPIPVPAVIPENIENETVAMQEQAAICIPQTEDAGEESSSNLMSQQSIPKLESAEKGEATIQDRDDEHEGCKAAPEEACHSKHPDTEVMNAVEATFEEEKLELTGSTSSIEDISKEVDGCNSQPTDSVSGEETNSDQLRGLEAPVSIPVPTVIPENIENETVAMQEQAAVSIRQTKDAREESSSDLMSQQSLPKQETAEKEEATVQDQDDEHMRSKEAPEEACHSNRPDTEVMDAVESTLEEEKLELTGSTRDIVEVSKEVDVCDSQPTDSVSGEETNSDKSRGLEAPVSIPVPTVIPENIENETVAMHEQAAVSIRQTEDAREESSSDLMSQQSLPKQETAEKEEAAVQDRDHEHERSKEASEEACSSKHVETEVMDAVEATFQEEKSELTGSTRELEEISREMDVSDSQYTKSVSPEEINSGQSRELENQVLTPVPTVIATNIENETVGMVEETKKENKTGVEMQQNEILELSSAAEMTKFEEKPTVNEHTETSEGTQDTPHEADKQAVTKGEDSEQQPLEEKSKTACVDSSIGEESIVTGSPADLPLERTEMVQEAGPRIQMEEKLSGLEDSESLNLKVQKVDIEADKWCENIIEATDIAQHETSHDKDHHGNGDDSGSESIKQSTKKDDVPEGRDYVIVTAEYDQAADTDERAKEENEEVSTSTNELSTEVQEVRKFDSVEQTGDAAGAIKGESMKEAEVTVEDCIEKDKQAEDVVSAANEATVDTPHKSAPVDALKVEHPENESKKDCAESPSAFEKSSELTVEPETISDLMSQRSEVAEQVQAETQTEEKPLESTDTEIRNWISEEETIEVGKESGNAGVADEIIQDDVSIEKDDSGFGKAHESESSEDAKETHEISPANLTTSEERDSSIFPAEEISENEATPPIKSAPSHLVADGNTDGQKLVSDALGQDAGEHVEEMVSGKAESSHEETILDVHESYNTPDERISTSIKETKEEEDVGKQVSREADARGEKIGSVLPEISTLKVDQSNIVLEKASQETAETEAIGAKEIEEALTTQCLTSEELEGTHTVSGQAMGPVDPVQATDAIEERTEENVAAGNKLEGEEIPKELSPLDSSNNRVPGVDTTPVSALPLEAESSDPGSITEQVEETTKEVHRQYNENLQTTSAAGATEDVFLEEAEEKSTKAAESVFDNKIHWVSGQLEPTEIKEKHFEVTTMDSLAEEESKKIIKDRENLPGIASRGEKQEFGKPHPMADGTTEEIHQENRLKDEEVIEEKTETLKSTDNELHFQEEVKGQAIDEGRAQNESELVFVEMQETKEIFPQEKEGNTARELVAELNIQSEKAATDSGNSLAEATSFKEEKEISEVEVAPSHKEFNDINQEIKQEERISSATPEGAYPSERSPCKTMDTVIPTGKDDAPLKMEETGVRTLEKAKESIQGPENPLPEHGGEEAVYTLGEKAREGPALTEEASASLPDLLKKSATEKLPEPASTVDTKDANDSLLQIQAEEAEVVKAEETKTDEERDEHEADEDEHKRLIPEQDALVVVESSKDIDVKAHHKKSHNILSGVGSKVKHSLSKVKKAITGKSSHSKTQPPKQTS